MNRDTIPLVLLLILLIAGVVGGCAWLILNLKPLAHLLLLLFLAASC